MYKLGIKTKYAQIKVQTSFPTNWSLAAIFWNLARTKWGQKSQLLGRRWKFLRPAPTYLHEDAAWKVVCWPFLILNLATKAMNDTINCDGLVASLLVLGVLLRLHSVRTTLLSELERVTHSQRNRNNHCWTPHHSGSQIQSPSILWSTIRTGRWSTRIIHEESVKWTGPFRLIRIVEKKHSSTVMEPMFNTPFISSVITAETCPPYRSDTATRSTTCFTSLTSALTLRYSSTVSLRLWIHGIDVANSPSLKMPRKRKW